MDWLLLPLSISLLMSPLCAAAQSSSNSTTVDFQVGVILDLNSSVGRISNSCISVALTDFYSVHKDYKTRLVPHFRYSNDSVIDSAAAALDLLQDVRVDAIIGPQSSAEVNFVMNLGDRAHVPIISFSATSPSLVPLAPYFVQTSQTDAYQVQAIASIIKAFKWNQVVIINEDTVYGNGIIPYLSNAIIDVNARISYRSAIAKSASDEFISGELYKMMTMQTRVFVVHASESLGTRLFLKVREIGMLTDGYAWIVTSGLTELFNFMDFEATESMQGVLGVRPLVPKSKEVRSFSGRCIRSFLLENPDGKVTDTSIFGYWAYDTLWALAMAAERFGSTRRNVVKNEGQNAANPFALLPSDWGPKLLEALLETRFPGLAGEFRLIKGQLQQTPYQIVNFVGNQAREVAVWRPFNKKENSNVRASNFTPKEKFRNITWPGDSTVSPKGWQIPANGKRLRVGVPQKPGFNEFLKVEMDNSTNVVQVSGYYKQVFDSVLAALPYAVIPYYVAFPFFNEDGSKAGYDDLVYHVSLQDRFDAAVGDITITAARSEVVDFTMPYAEGGVTCVVPIMHEDPNTFKIFKALTKQLWVAAALFYIFNALAIWFIGRRIISNGDEPPGQHPGMICYFPCFPGQGLHANLLCSILVAWSSVWCLLNSTFTASLSSTLVAQSLLPTVTDMNHLIKNGDYVGYQEGSFVYDFLMKSGFKEFKIKNCSSIEVCDNYLSLGSKKGGISAYCDVVPHITLFLSQTCGKYMTIGATNRTEGFAFAFPRGSPLVSDVSRAIIQLTEKGTIQEIEKQLTSNTTCSYDSPGAGTAIGLQNFEVFFVFSGCVTVACLLVSQLVVLYKNGVLLQKMSGLKVNVSSRIDAFRCSLTRSNSRLLPMLQDPQIGLQVVDEVGVPEIKTAGPP